MGDRSKHCFEIQKNYKNAEALEQIVIEAPEKGTAILQALVYNNAYFFPGMDRPGWINVLADLGDKLEVETLLAGGNRLSERM